MKVSSTVGRGGADNASTSRGAYKLHRGFIGHLHQKSCMSESVHERAAEMFARRVREQYGDVVDTIILYGSVARGDHVKSDSDIDLLVVLKDNVDVIDYEEAIRELAYDVELEHGVILSLVVLSASEYRHETTPFLDHVRRDAEPLHG